MFEFKFPTFQDTNWEKHFQEADEIDKVLLPCFKRAIEIVQDIETEATPQSLAWMIIWTHIFKTLNGAQAAVHKEAELSLQLLNRSCMELELIIFAISSPARTSNSDPEKKIKENLTAYAAWCLWKDISARDRRLERRNVNALFDDSNNREVADPKEIEFVEKLIGQKIQLQDPEEIEKDRRTYEENIWESQEKLKAIANHPELKPWIDKLEGNSIRAKQNKEKWISSYFKLIGESETSIMKRLIKLDIAHAYSKYEETSLVQHASTFSQLFYLHTDGKAYPTIKVPKDIIKRIAGDIASTCNYSLAHLAALKMYIKLA